jgi:hypothetical protein
MFQPPVPIIVDVAKAPEPARDITVDVVLGIFAFTGVMLLAAAVGSALVGGAIILYRRYRDSTGDPESHTQSLRL